MQNSLIKKSIEHFLTESENFSLSRRKFSYLPFYGICGDFKDTKAIKTSLQKLNIFPNFKKKISSFLILKNFLPSIKINVPKGVSLIFFGHKIKLFDFENNKVYTLSKKCSLKNEFIKRKKAFKYLKNIQVGEIKNNILTEDLLYPQEKISEEDILNLFIKLSDMYNQTLKSSPIEDIINDRLKRFPLKNKKFHKIISKKLKGVSTLSCISHGDFWKGNIIKSKRELYLIDWSDSGRGTILEDFFNFFAVEYLFSKKVSKFLFRNLKKRLLKNFKISEKEFSRLFDLEFLLYKISLPRNDWKKLDSFRKLIVTI